MSIATTGNEKNCFTIVLACCVGGTKLNPLVIFKRKTLPKEPFPSGIIVSANKKGWMNEDVMKLWLNQVLRKRPGAFFK